MSGSGLSDNVLLEAHDATAAQALVALVVSHTELKVALKRSSKQEEKEMFPWWILGPRWCDQLRPRF